MYDRICADVYVEDEKFAAQCTKFYDDLFTSIRTSLNAGQDGAQICTGFGLCQDNQSAMRLKFSAFNQQHVLFLKHTTKMF